MGVASGHNSAEPIAKIAEIHTSLEAVNAFDPLTADYGAYDNRSGIYSIMRYFAEGVYKPTRSSSSPDTNGEVTTTWTVVIPNGTDIYDNTQDPPVLLASHTVHVKGGGAYSGGTAQSAFENAWLNGLIPAAKYYVEQVGNAHADLIAEADAYHEQVTDQLTREYINHSRAQSTDGAPLDLTATPASHAGAIQFATSLHQYGQDTTAGGAAQVLEKLANTSTLGGQCMVAAMREGRNIARLQNANLGQDTQLNNATDAPQATLLSGKYTADEAIAALQRPIVG